MVTDTEIISAISQAGERLGFQQRPRQQEVVLAFLKGRDVFVSLLTGSGKSLCYSILPWVFDLLWKRATESSVVVVVSPLIALMKDQVESLQRKNFTAICISETTGNEELITEVHEGMYRVVFFGLERLLTDVGWRDMLQSTYYRETLVGFIIDEAHCVKMW